MVISNGVIKRKNFHTQFTDVGAPFVPSSSWIKQHPAQQRESCFEEPKKAGFYRPVRAGTRRLYRHLLPDESKATFLNGAREGLGTGWVTVKCCLADPGLFWESQASPLSFWVVGVGLGVSPSLVALIWRLWQRIFVSKGDNWRWFYFLSLLANLWTIPVSDIGIIINHLLE